MVPIAFIKLSPMLAQGNKVLIYEGMMQPLQLHGCNTEMHLPVRPSLPLLILLFNHLLTLARPSNGSASPFPAVLAFGDSILDTGNNNVLHTVVKCNFPPYGKDFIGQRATGRFSNGKVASDLLVSYLGIKELLPAYLGPDLRSEDLLTGVCFASGGTGYDGLTAKLLSLLSMPDQLELFKDYKRKLQAIAGEETTARIIDRSLYIVSGGTNDIVNTYFLTPVRKAEYDVFAYANFLARSASDFVQDLYHLGARRIGVVGLPPLGCLPSQRTLAGGFERDCAMLYNQASQKYNRELSMELQMLSKKLPGTRIVYIDIYDRLLAIIHHPVDYGFQDSMDGCCGTGTLEISILCNNITSDTCVDDEKYVFWDSFHPTQRAYEIVVNQVLQEYINLLI